MAGAGRKVVRTMTCAECGQEFTRLVFSHSLPKFCSAACRRAAAARAQANRLHAARVAAGDFGRFALENDPWHTGQLPQSITQNALWR